MNLGNMASVGIIGGADGPTAILVAGDPAGPWLAAGFAILALAGGIWYLTAGRRRPKGRKERKSQ